MRSNFFLVTAILMFAFCGLAEAHPLGNFSINQSTGVEIDAGEVRLRQFLDMAEIPTFQATGAIDTDRNGELSEAELNTYLEKITPDYVANLLVLVDGQTVPLRPTAQNIILQPGAGDLSTLRIEWELAGTLPFEKADDVHRLKFENRNYADRIGWNEIVVGRVRGINVFDSTAYGSGISNELRAYPGELLTAPLAERAAEFAFTSAPLSAGQVPLQNRDGHATAAATKDRFAELITVPEITPSIILFGLLIAFGLGALHALSPGHGKAVVGAYLVGSRGTPKHAMFLGLTVTVTHTLGVFALGLLTLFASNYILPERLMPFLTFFSGLLVLFIGLTLFKDRLLKALGYKSDGHHHHHDHDHHDHPHSHEAGLAHTHGGSTHTHLPPEQVTWRNLLALGISGGLLPCPSALVLMLSAISLGRIGYGLVLTLMFSIGLAATLTGIGLIFLYIGKFFENRSLAAHPVIRALPVFSAFVITCVGAVICYQAL